MTQRFSLYEDLSIRENLDFIARMYAVPRSEGGGRSALERLGLDRRSSSSRASCPGGWKQRLALAACLLHEPRAAAPRRADGGRRSEGAARILGADPRARRARASRCSLARITWMRRSAATSSPTSHTASCSRPAPRTRVVAQSRLSTWAVRGPDLVRARARTEKTRPAWRWSCRSATTLHVSGVDEALLERDGRRLPRPRPDSRMATRRARPRRRFHPYSCATHQRTSFASERLFLAPVRGRHREGIRADAARPADVRDDGRHPDPAARPVRLRDQLRPAARCRPRCSRADASVFARSFVRALENSGYFRVVRNVQTEAEAERVAGARRGAVRADDPGELRARARARRTPGAADGGGRDRSRPRRATRCGALRL